MHPMVDESQVLLDLRVAAIVPVTHRGPVKFQQQKLKIAIQRDFLQGLAVFDAELKSVLRRHD